MNTIKLSPECIESGEYCAIKFTKSIFVELIIDNEPYYKISEEFFSDSVICFSELKRSTMESGKFIIFNCACGIAECGGYEGVNITHDENRVNWRVIDYREEFNFEFSFDREQYIQSVSQCDHSINKISNYTLEPTNLIYPEDWSST